MKHQIALHDRSIVIVGQNHNPSILNPDFLWRHRIVPEDIALAGDVPPISTPMISRCTFKNNFQIESEPNRIIFSQKCTAENPSENSGFCYEVAKRYLRVVPLVHYSAVGINFSSSVPDLDSKLTPYAMLKSGRWDQFESVTPSAEVLLTYHLVDGAANLTIKREQSTDAKHEQRIVFVANFHHDIQVEQDESHKVAIATVDDWEKDRERFTLLVNNIIKNLEEK